MYSEDHVRILNRMCKNYQSVWVINLEDGSMRLFAADYATSIPGAVDVINSLNSYEKSRQIYLEKYVALRDRKRLSELTAIDNIIAKTIDGRPYFIEYNREYDGNSNFNQLYYAKYEADEEEMKNIVLAFCDIDIRKKIEIDELTGVLTRQYFFQRSEWLLKQFPGVQFDVLISDIVDFKNINETYGDAKGDEVLKWSGEFLSQNSDDDVLVGRYAGDQFAVVARHELIQSYANSDAFEYFIEAARRSGQPPLNVKFGIYEDIGKASSVMSACDKAHTALNSIKHKYGQFVAFYDEVIKRQLEIDRRIENSMYDALKDEQFKVYYQPKHDAVSGRLIGAEGLIRWIHPEYGFMSPGDFIPLFERNGFVVESDYYVWEHTCKNIKKWQDEGLYVVPISVNASRLTFRRSDLIDRLKSVTESYGVAPEKLHIEVTETMMTEDIDALVEKLNNIRSYGFQIELDDFGSGYSSINILSSLPLDVVKLDMSFMKQFGDIKRAKVLAACIKLAKELGYKTVSEGVEYKEQNDMLGVLGVDAIQGYYYSRPLSETDFEEYLRRQTS